MLELQQQMERKEERSGFFFCFPSAVRAVAARYKLPFCSPPKSVPKCRAYQ